MVINFTSFFKRTALLPVILGCVLLPGLRAAQEPATGTAQQTPQDPAASTPPTAGQDPAAVPPPGTPAPDAQLEATIHPALPPNPSDLWLVPSESDRAARSLATYAPLVDGIRRYQAGQYATAIALLTQPSLAKTTLADYAGYYTGLSELRLGQVPAARRTFEQVLERKPQGYMSVAAAIGAAEAAEAVADYREAAHIYDRLADHKPAATEDVLSRLGRAALASGDRAKAAQAFLRVYYEFPLTDSAMAAAAQLTGLQDQITRSGY